MEEDGGLNQKPRAKSTSEAHNNAQESLVSIHENVLSFLLSSGILKTEPLKVPKTESNCEREKYLQALRLKRIYLASEIASIRSRSALCTAREDPGETKEITVQTSSFLEETAASLEALWESEEQDGDRKQQHTSDNLAVSMQRIRNKRKLHAAYRLGGITAAVPQSDPELLSIRFDICLDGEYVACYHAFFDLIVAEAKRGTEDEVKKDKTINGKEAGADTTSSESRLFLRLVQHTIPSSIPLQDICDQTLGGSLFELGDLHCNEDWQTLQFQRRIRSWCRQCYRACWCLARRKQTWNTLERLRQKAGNERDADQIVNFVNSTSATDSLEQMSFQLSLKDQSSGSGVRHLLDVQLYYGDPMRGQPTKAKIEALPWSTQPSFGSSQQQESVPSDISENGDGDGNVDKNQNIVKRAQKAFLELPMGEALEQLKVNHGKHCS